MEGLRVLLDTNMWREAAWIGSNKEIILKAIKWGPSIGFHWQAQFLPKTPTNEAHKIKLICLKEILDRARKSQLELVTTTLADNELSRKQKLNRHHLYPCPTILDPETSMYMDLLKKGLLPDGVTPSNFYSWENAKQTVIRKLYVENFDDPGWQSFVKSANLTGNLSDAFIFWQSSKYDVDYIVTADVKTFRNPAYNWAKQLGTNLKVLTPTEFIDMLGLKTSDLEEYWHLKLQSIFHQQRILQAGSIEYANGKYWFLKGLWRRDIGFIPPSDPDLTPTTRQILMALFNLYFPNFKGGKSKGQNGYFGAKDFDIN